MTVQHQSLHSRPSTCMMGTVRDLVWHSETVHGYDTEPITVQISALSTLFGHG
jgi:hypothetical protein